MHKIAVITPCYNSADFILDCMQSVALANTFGICEITHIIVDDASTDDTWNIINRSKISNLLTFRLIENKGSAFARNYAIKHCDADFIFCLDSDDVLFQNSLFSLLTAAIEKKADWVYGDILRGDDQLRYLSGRDYFGWNFKTTQEVLIALFKNEHFFQHSSLFSKKAFEKAGRYDETLRMAVDFDLFTRMLLCEYPPFYLPGPLFIHRFHNNNLSRLYTADPKKHEQTIRKLYEKYVDRLKLTLSKDAIATIEQAHSAWSKIG